MNAPRVALATLLAATLASRVHAAEGALASPAVDRSLYREGEVQRTSRDFGAWTVVCDEVVRLKQRFCSLKTSLRDASRKAVAELFISTGDNGRPAAMLRVAHGAHIGSGVQLTLNRPAPTRGKPAAALTRKLDFATCDQAACLVVWSLRGDDISALNVGAVVRARLMGVQAVNPFVAPIATPARMRIIDASVDGAGFAQAVNSTLGR